MKTKLTFLIIAAALAAATAGRAQTVISYSTDGGAQALETGDIPQTVLDTATLEVSYRMEWLRRPDREKPMQDLLLLQAGGKVTKFFSYKTLQRDSLLRITPAEQVLANYIAEENAQREEDNLLYAVYGKEKKDLITGGAIVAVDCRTGEPLCMASYPTFTLETMLDDYAELNRDENRPLFNRCLLGTYSPGSTFKLCTALAGLCEGKVYLGEEIDCTGQFTLYETAGYAPYCWNIYGHGPMDLVNGILNSCNVFFWTVGDRLGNELIYDYATRLGMGQRTGIELPEYKGYVATPEVKAEIFKGTEDAGWYSGDTLQLAIGQSVTQITPLQIARYVAAIANSGTVYNCSILKSAVSYDYARTIYEREPDIYGEIEADAEIWDAIHEGMYGVTHSPAGSGYSAFNGYTVEVAGKTGTTQNVGTNDGLFVCYAPFDDPEIAVAVVLENGGAGAEVAEMARQVLEYYFSFRDSTAQLEQEMTLLR